MFHASLFPIGTSFQVGDPKPEVLRFLGEVLFIHIVYPVDSYHFEPPKSDV